MTLLFSFFVLLIRLKKKCPHNPRVVVGVQFRSHLCNPCTLPQLPKCWFSWAQTNRFSQQHAIGMARATLHLVQWTPSTHTESTRSIVISGYQTAQTASPTMFRISVVWNSLGMFCIKRAGYMWTCSATPIAWCINASWTPTSQACWPGSHNMFRALALYFRPDHIFVVLGTLLFME
jgi:hypothetical protein